jgi:hypothetical protein
MHYINKKVTLTILVLTMLLPNISLSTEYYTMKIYGLQKQLKVGEPLLINLIYNYKKPKTSPTTGDIKRYLMMQGLHLQVRSGTEEIEQTYKIMTTKLTLQGTQGLEYKGLINIFYDFSRSKLIFEQSGPYYIRVMNAQKTLSSNSLEVLVLPASYSEKKALSILSDPNDFIFLLGGVYEKSERTRVISNLENLVVQCEGILLAKMASARLGLEYFDQFHKKHPSFEKFKTKLEQGQIQEPLFDKAYKYLSTGYALPDESPIRESVLGHLVETEFINGNYKKAISLVDELCTKYPDGEYGQKASMWKKELVELQELQELESGQSTNPPLSQASRFAALPVVVAVVATGIALIVLFFIFKKKPASTGK